MDPNGDSAIQTSNETLSRYQFIKKTLQFLIPLSLLSISLSHIMDFSFYFNYMNFQFSTLIFALFAHALDRKLAFLICNGILAFLAKSSSLFKQIPQPTAEDNEASMKSSLLESAAVAEEEKKQQGTGSFHDQTEDEDEVEDGTTLDGDSHSLVEEGNYVNVNTDELNKKIEEFIKKMKEEIRIEAQQQLVECN